MKTSLSIAVVALASAVATSAWASADGDAKRLAEAATVLKEIHAAPDKDIPQELWEKAHCVAVIPSVKKAAFIVGGEYGKGVLSCRTGAEWSAPSFLEPSERQCRIPDWRRERRPRAAVHDRSKRQPLVRQQGRARRRNIGRRGTGRTRCACDDRWAVESANPVVFAGAGTVCRASISTGGVLKADTAENREFYGRGYTAREILKDHKVNPPAAAAEFLSALRSTMPNRTQQ